MNSNALEIKALIVHHAVFTMKHVLVAVEPSFSAHDVWSMSKARLEYEWEVKQSMGDLYREKRKPKHRNGWFRDPVLAVSEGAPNRFYIVVPMRIGPQALKWVNLNLPYAGLAWCDDGITIVKAAPELHRGRASLRRCSRVARWMSVTLADLMGQVGGTKPLETA